MSTPEQVPGLVAQLHEALQLDAYGDTVRITLSTGMTLSGDVLAARTVARVEAQSVTDAGRSKWTKVGMPLYPPDGQGLPELVEILAVVARGEVTT
jgi:hypothetical protein